MSEQREELIRILELELERLRRGGYEASAGDPLSEPVSFRGSTACINHWLVPGREEETCAGCVLLEFVPEEFRFEEHACRFIPLTSEGRTVGDFEGDHSGLRDAVEAWLSEKLRQLRQP